MGVQTLPVVASNNSQMQEQRITASGTWIAPSNVNKVWVEMIGGGGSGAKANTAGGGAGMPGGIIRQQSSVVAGTAYSITIGAGGAAATAQNQGGNNGSATTFNSLTGAGGFGGKQFGNQVYAVIEVNWGGGIWGQGPISSGTAGTANTGMGGAGGNYGASGPSGAGGSGIVILKWIS
jgi:hypothetical protein